jgi:hypothetical protein
MINKTPTPDSNHPISPMPQVQTRLKDRDGCRRVD